MEWLENAERLVFLTNNTCNLSCKYCNTGCHIPIGETSFRNKIWEYKQEDFKQCVDTFSSKTPRIRLCGGETTLLDPDKINESIAYAKGKIKLDIISNGYNVMGINYEDLDHVYLDDHICNSAVVKEVYEVIHDKVPTTIFYRHEHYDVEWMTEHGVKTGKTCNIFKKLPMIYNDVLFPCCSSIFFNPKLYDVMNNAGWNIYNDNLLTASETLPNGFWDVCRTSCYGNCIEKPTDPIMQMHQTITRK